MNDSDWLAVLGIICIALFACGCINAYHNLRNSQLFNAERSCSPGMVYQVNFKGKVTCIGGDGETWRPIK